MKHLTGSLRKFIVILAGLLLVSAPAQSLDFRDGTSPTLPGAGPESGGFQLLAELEKPTVTVGEKVVLKLTVQNVSKDNLTFWTSNPRTEFKLTVTDEAGRGVPGNANLYGGLTFSSGSVIEPGGQVLDDYNVNGVFGDDIRKPGKYHITARTYVYGKTNADPKIMIVSNTVILAVVEPKTSRSAKGEDR
jgi:hypothetical protein